METNRLNESGCGINIGREVVLWSFTVYCSYELPRSGGEEDAWTRYLRQPEVDSHSQMDIQESRNNLTYPFCYIIVFPLTTSTTKGIVPGPGAHNMPPSMDPKGRYSLSKYKNSLARVWNPKKSERFARCVTEVPGPGSYQPNNDLSNSGHYVLSNNPSSGKRVILNSGRSCFVDETAKLAQGNSI